MLKESKHLLIFLDLLVLIATSMAAYFLRFGYLSVGDMLSVESIFAVFVVICSYYIFGAYSYNGPKFRFKNAIYLLLACLASAIFLASVIYLFRGVIYGLTGRGFIIGSLAGFWFLTAIIRVIVVNNQSKSMSCRKFLVICENEYYEAFKADISENTQGEKYHFILAKAYDIAGDVPNDIIGTLDSVKDIVHKGIESWTGLIVGLNSKHVFSVEEPLMEARISGLPVYSLSDYYEQLWEKVPVYNLNRTWFVFTGGFRLIKNSFRFRVKRSMDIILALVLLFLSFPLQILTALLVALSSKGPIFFKQKRSGELGKPFEIFKFRTMKLHQQQEGLNWTTEKDNRITRIGKFLRLSRLDELPQLINVLKGEMSFIGPRPERPEFEDELASQIPFYRLRYQVKPGITGWAQVLYRYGASVHDAKEKLQYDLYYIKNYSFTLDLVILFKTVRVVLGAKGR